MPRTNSITRNWRTRQPGIQIPVPVLVVTTFDLDEYVFAALQPGPAVPAQGRGAGRALDAVRSTPAATAWSPPR